MKRTLGVGFVVGLIFGVVNLLFTWLAPLSDDTIPALLLFYGPMFLIWILVAFRETRATGRFAAGVVAGATVAFGTFCIYVLLNFARVNIFLDQLAGRLDWQSMMQRFRASNTDSLRWFVNLDYLQGTPSKMAVSVAIGAVMGVVGSSLGYLRHVQTSRA
jgi:hypothetical protein